jgi:hypothetical protein
MPPDFVFYALKTDFYFQAEFSDWGIAASIDRLIAVEYKPAGYWKHKINRVLEVHHAARKPPQDAAAFIARLFRPRLKTLLRAEEK